MKATASALGSCGELVQGMFGQEHFHLSCPVNLSSKVTVILKEKKTASDQKFMHTYKQAFSTGYYKTAVAIKKILALKGLQNQPFWFKIERSFPSGKGLASSTADIAAAMRATASLIGLKLTDVELAKIASSIEPTDGTIFSELVVFNHKKGELLFKLGAPPPLKITYLDRGGVVDTLAYDKKRFYSLKAQRESEKILALAVEAVQKKDWELLGQATTLSVLLHKKQLSSDWLSFMLAMKKKTKAYGLVMAHSGTVIGLLHDGKLNLPLSGWKEVQLTSKISES